MEMVDMVMQMTGSTDNDFSLASEVLEEIGFTVGQKLMEKYVQISSSTVPFRCHSRQKNARQNRLTFLLPITRL